MVEIGQPAIRPVDFESQLHARLPVEVIERDALIARVGERHLVASERPSFHLLMLMRSRGGSHTVDFTEIPSRPGRLVQVRPGQIQAFNTRSDFAATLVLSQPAWTSERPWFPGHASYCDLDQEATTTCEAIITALRGQQERFGGEQPTTRVMISLFSVLLAVFDQAQTETGDTGLPPVYVLFRNAIESDLTHSNSVADYGRRIGYSTRTVTRACQKATGQTAKRVLTDRLVLEAQRLLVHTDAAAGAISARLGFSEPTNFTKFFTHNTNETPSSFRDHHRSRTHQSR